MSRSRLLLAGLGGAAAAAMVTTAAIAVPCQPTPTTRTSLAATLNGASEVPGPGDPNAVGGALITVIDGLADQVCVSLGFSGVDGTLSGLHIHLAPPTSLGPIAVHLPIPTSTSYRQCVPVTDQALIDNLEADPGAYYINLHSVPNYPAGAIRGQLRRLFG